MNITLVIFITILVVGFIYLKIKMPTIKGTIGEKKVSVTLAFLPKDEYIVLNDVMLKKGEYTTQIDHIVVSVYGIFVVETKNYKGLIYGSSYNDKWTQNIWGNKYSLYNPILQNKKHIKFLVRNFDMLKAKEEYIYPIIVFLNATDLRISGDANCVLWRSQLNHYIKSHSQVAMTIEECHQIASILRSENIIDKKEKSTHKTNARIAAYHHEQRVQNGICPLCGGTLKLRQGKYGGFYGCSNYPNCRFTRSFKM